MSKSILKLRDVNLIDIKTDCDNFSGCETCGYGSYFCDSLEFYFDNNRRVEIEVIEDFASESSFSYGNLMSIFTNNCKEIEELYFDEFKDYIVRKIKEIVDPDVDPDEYYHSSYSVNGYTY